VQLSLHPAPDNLGFTLCSCGGSRGSSGELPLDYLSASCYDYHQRDEGVIFHQIVVCDRTEHMNGSAFLGL
jgi:hypothetical protein